MSLFRLVASGLVAGVLFVASLNGAGHVEGGHQCHKARWLTAGRAAGSDRHYAPSRQIDIRHQALEVTPDFERRSIAGSIRIEFQPIALPLPELKLDAVDLAIAGVDASAAILGWQNTGEHLIVTFQESIPAEKVSWVVVTYSVDEPAQGLYFRTPAMGYREGDTHLWTQGEMHEARHWYPCYDYPNEKFTTEMLCHVPEGMVALSNGRLVSREADPGSGRVAWRWLQEQPHVNYLVTLCAGYFEKIEDRYREIPLAFWTPPSRIAFARNSFAGTKEMLAFYERELGVDYPWARYDQVVVDDFNWGGMENTAQTTLTDGTLYADELAGTRSSLGLVAHELVHQWFGNYVTCKDWSHIWLNEGFATYYEALYREHAQGRDDFLWDMLGNARAVLDQPDDVVPIVYRDYGDPEEQFGFRAYPKGAWILHMLRSQLGPDLYRRCVRTYLERHALGVVTTDDFVKVLEEVSGRDWDRFFDQYVYHAHQPNLRVEYSWDERSKLAKVSIEQTQTLGPTVLLFHLPLTLRFQCGADTVDGVAHVSRQREDFHFALPRQPDIVRVDPDSTWLAKVDFPLPVEMLHAQLADSSDLIGRVFAIEQLAERKDPATLGKLQDALNTDPFWGLRVEAAKALRQIHTEEARTALLASMDQSDARVRREVIQGVAAFFRGETPALLAQAIQDEANPDIVADVIRALGAYPVEGVRETLVAQLGTTSYQQLLADAAVDAIRDQRDPVYLDPLLRVLREREGELTTGGFSSGLETLAVLAAEQEDRSPYREFLVARVHHPKLEVQLAALRALGTLGDPRAIAVLETFAGGGKDLPRTKAAEAAIRRLRERRPQSAEVDALRKEVLELKQQHEELEKRLETALKQWESVSRTEAAAAPE